VCAFLFKKKSHSFDDSDVASTYIDDGESEVHGCFHGDLDDEVYEVYDSKFMVL